MIRKAENSYTIVFTGGSGPEAIPMCQKDYISVIAADSGYDLAIKNGFNPDSVIGDLDSTVNRDLLISSGIVPVNRDKDESDTELALRLAGENYDLAGGGEGRLDHLMGILGLFPIYGVPRFWFTEKDTIIGVRSYLKMKIKPGSLVSVFPAEGESMVKSKGLKWELGDRRITSTYISLSNVALSSEIEICCDKPILVRIDPECLIPHSVNCR